MKAKVINKLYLFLTVLFIWQCENVGHQIDSSHDPLAKILPESSLALGKAVAQELNASIQRMHRDGIDYSYATNTLEFRTQFCADFFAASSLSSKMTRSSFDKTIFSPSKIIDSYNNLTLCQRSYIERIINECSASKSRIEVYNKLKVIAEDIVRNVPEVQQTRLLNVISVLYYGQKEIEELERGGLMILTPRSLLRPVLTKNNYESLGTTETGCYRFYATAWAVALGEPTLIGEAVMIVTSVVLVYVAGQYLYDVVVCPRETDTDEESNKKRQDCIERYNECINEGKSDNCDICLHYCVTQGVWPPYETHRCY